MRPCPACSESTVRGNGSLNGWKIAHCPRCGLRYTIDVPSDNQLNALYERMYAPGHDYQMYRNEIRQILHSPKAMSVGFYRSSVFLNMYKPSPGERLLEIGCGVGTFLLAAHRKGWQVEGIDISETALAASREVHQLPVRQGNFDDLLFEEGVFRVVACWEVMEHLATQRNS